MAIAAESCKYGAHSGWLRAPKYGLRGVIALNRQATKLAVRRAIPVGLRGIRRLDVQIVALAWHQRTTINLRRRRQLPFRANLTALRICCEANRRCRVEVAALIADRHRQVRPRKRLTMRDDSKRTRIHTGCRHCDLGCDVLRLIEIFENRKELITRESNRRVRRRDPAPDIVEIRYIGVGRTCSVRHVVVVANGRLRLTTRRAGVAHRTHRYRGRRALGLAVGIAASKIQRIRSNLSRGHGSRRSWRCQICVGPSRQTHRAAVQRSATGTGSRTTHRPTYGEGRIDSRRAGDGQCKIRRLGSLRLASSRASTLRKATGVRTGDIERERPRIGCRHGRCMSAAARRALAGATTYGPTGEARGTTKCALCGSAPY